MSDFMREHEARRANITTYWLKQEGYMIAPNWFPVPHPEYNWKINLWEQPMMKPAPRLYHRIYYYSRYLVGKITHPIRCFLLRHKILKEWEEK